MLLRQPGQTRFQASQCIPAACNLQNQRAVLAVPAQACAGNCAAILLAYPTQYVGQLHGVGTEGADDEKLFTDRRGGHAAFLSREVSEAQTCITGRQVIEKPG